jgi:hypothetical protein
VIKQEDCWKILHQPEVSINEGTLLKWMGVSTLNHLHFFGLCLEWKIPIKMDDLGVPSGKHTKKQWKDPPFFIGNPWETMGTW